MESRQKLKGSKRIKREAIDRVRGVFKIVFTLMMVSMWIMSAILFKVITKQADIRYETTDDVINHISELYDELYIGGRYTDDQINDGIVSGFVEGTGDKYGVYVNPEDAKHELSQMNDGSLVGLGVTIIADEEGITVIGVNEDSPALDAGLKVGYRIIEVDGISLEGMEPNKAVKYLRGKEGTEVKLKVTNGDKVEELKMIRRRVALKDIEYNIIENEIGYIKIHSFTKGTHKEFKEAIEFMGDNSIDKYIFDVRNNSGGLLKAVIDMTNEVVPEGLIARTVDKTGAEDRYMSNKNEIQGDMVVLVNGNTASASELFALALRDFDKATIVGEQTFGKGTMISMLQLPNGGLLSLSTGLLYTKDSPNIEGVGVEPDIEIEQDEFSAILGEEADLQLEKAIYILK